MNLSLQLYKIIFVILFKLFLVTILCWIIYLLLTYKKFISRDSLWYMYKINNFISNKIFICVYIIIFILFFTYLRLKRISLSLDLNHIALKFNNVPLNLLNRIFLLLVYLLLLLL